MKKFIIPALLLAPALASAQQLGNITTFVNSIGNLVRIATPIVVGIALLGFFWGLAKFIFSAGNEDAKKEGTRMMIWGIVGFFVMVSVWGLVNFIGQNLGVGAGSGNNPPSIPIPTVQR